MFPPGLVYACYSHLLLIPPGDSAPALPQSPFHSTPQSSLPANPVLTRPHSAMPCLACITETRLSRRVHNSPRHTCIARPIRTLRSAPFPACLSAPVLARPCASSPALPIRLFPLQSKPGESCLNSSNSQLQVFLSFQELGFTLLVFGDPNELI